MKRVHIKGKSVPVERKAMQRFDGLAYKRSKNDKRPVRRRIVLAKRLRGVKKLSTLVHEMLHMVDHRLSEKTVLQLEDAITEMVIDNPEVFHGLWED